MYVSTYPPYMTKRESEPSNSALISLQVVIENRIQELNQDSLRTDAHSIFFPELRKNKSSRVLRMYSNLHPLAFSLVSTTARPDRRRGPVTFR